MFSIPHKETFHLGIAIGTGSVNAICYATKGNEKPRIHSMIMRPHSILPQADFRALEEFVTRELGELKKALHESIRGVHIQTIHVLLSSPWYFSQTRIVTIQREKPFVIEHAFLKENLKEEKEKFIHAAQNQFSLTKERYAVIEMAFMKIRMNGYEVNNFLHKTAKEITLDMYMSVSSRDFISHIQHFLETHFSPRDIIFHTPPFLFFKTLKQAWPHEENKPLFDIDEGLLAVEVGSEITDITVIRKGIIEETFSFGKGIHFIIRRLASAFGMPPADALSLFHVWDRGEIESRKKEKIDAIIGNAVDEWKILLHNVLRDASRGLLLPSSLLFLGEGASFSGFAKAFADEQCKEYILENKTFDVVTLSPSFFRSSYEGPGALFRGETQTPPLYMLALPIEYNRLE